MAAVAWDRREEAGPCAAGASREEAERRGNWGRAKFEDQRQIAPNLRMDYE